MEDEVKVNVYFDQINEVLTSLNHERFCYVNSPVTLRRQKNNIWTISMNYFVNSVYDTEGLRL